MSSVTIVDEQHGEIAILKLRGSFIGSTGASTFERAIFPLLKKDVKWIVLDMHRLRIVDSAGLGSMVAAMVSIKRRGGALKLAGVGGEIERIVKNMHPDRVFSVYESVSVAEESFLTRRGT
jgi:anti-anti-sigma factor